MEDLIDHLRREKVKKMEINEEAKLLGFIHKMNHIATIKYQELYGYREFLYVDCVPIEEQKELMDKLQSLGDEIDAEAKRLRQEAVRT